MAQEQMSAVCRIPLVKLTGISPSGLNASSEGEIRVYYDLIHSAQEFLIRPQIQTILDFVQIELFEDVDSDITFDFVELYEMTEVEAAGKRSTEAQTDGTLIEAGVISPEEARARVAADPDTPYVDLDPMKMPQAPADPNAPKSGGDAWSHVLKGLAQSGGVSVPEAPDGKPSNEAHRAIFGGLAKHGGMNSQPQVDLGFVDALGQALAQDMDWQSMPSSSNIEDRTTGGSSQSQSSQGGGAVGAPDFQTGTVQSQPNQGGGRDAFDPQESRKPAGKGGGEWTKGSGGGAQAEKPKREKRMPNGYTKAEIDEFNRRDEAPSANLEGDTPEARAKIARIREMAIKTGVDPSTFYYGGSGQVVNLARRAI
jgi:Protein of unknown function (DUF1073)